MSLQMQAKMRAPGNGLLMTPAYRIRPSISPSPYPTDTRQFCFEHVEKH